jgi:hypothetical protein
MDRDRFDLGAQIVCVFIILVVCGLIAIATQG